MITIYKTNTMKDCANYVMQVVNRVDKTNLNATHTIIVPDRASMETERLLLKTVGGSFNAQVLTFRRLASRILPKYDYLSKQAGIMALAGIIQDNKHLLKCYVKGVDTPGFVADMYDTISMMKYCKITPQMLAQPNLPKGVKNKAQDISVIYQAYLDYTKDRFIDSADKMDLLCQYLGEVDSVKEGYFYIFDFDNLSAQELAIVEKLMLASKGVTVACCVGNGAKDKYLYLDDIYHGVLDICARNGIQPNVISNTFADKNPYTKHIGQSLYRYTQPTAMENDGFVEIFQGETRYNEVYNLGCRIQQYVRSGGRFKDVYVVTSDVDKYANAISTVFSQLQIPYFCDKQFCLADQSYSQFVIDYLTLYRNNGRLQSVLSFVKNYIFCGDFDQAEDKTDVYKFENYCLKYNVSYRYDHFTLGKSDELYPQADSFRKKFNDLYKQVVIPQVASANDYVARIRQLLELSRADQKNEAFALRQQQLGYTALANVTDQTVEKFRQVLLQAEAIMGNRVMRLEDFIKTLTTALSSVKISVLPQQNDCVVFANMAKARKHDILFLALLGANHGAMPIVKADCKLLNDNNIKALQSVNVNVEPQIYTENKRERFSLFQLLQEPTKHLYVSFATVDGSDSLIPSSFVAELCSLFTDKGEPLQICQESDDQIYTSTQAVAQVVLNKRRFADRQMVKMPSFNILSEQFRSQTDKYEWSKKGLDVTVNGGERLYFKSDRTSVSQLTDFFKCPYRFYVEYGLNAKPREVAELKSADLGNILHEVMENYVADMERAESDDITAQKANRWYDNALDMDFYKGLKSDAQMQGALEQLRAEAVRMCLVIKKQLAHSQFQNIKTELAFGDGNVPPVVVDLGDGKFNLVGKIDRVDGYGDHLIIIDYKSGAQASHFTEKDLYIGQKMQLLVYLQAAKDFYNKRPAGFYYFNMHNNFTDLKTDKVYTYNGRTLDDLDMAIALDNTLQTGASEKLGLRLKKDGQLNRQGSKLLTAEQFQNQMDYAFTLIKRAGQLMQRGYAAVSPYEHSCDYCDYKDICDFGDVYTYPERKVESKVTAKTIDETVKK